MHVAKPTLHLMARQAIEEIERSGVKLDPDEILWLHELATRESHNSDLTELSAWLEFPRKCGPLLFYPVSMAGEAWYSEKASAWFVDDPKRNILALAYLLCNSRNVDAYASIVTKQDAVKMLKAWQRTLPISFTALATAVDEFISQSQSVEVVKETESERFNVRRHWGLKIPWLCRYYGGTREDWLYRKSATEFREMVDKLPQVMEMDDGNDSKGNRHIEFHAAVMYLKRGRVAA